ncbi:hypothetical protein [Dyella subtropica]|uniref:hypothetical protein n=1 Tax=Dyella subtropica TaxID=2992127 RepID=UPI00225C0CB8|nr:hypothetical protein [Dyella subtropica]
MLGKLFGWKGKKVGESKESAEMQAETKPSGEASSSGDQMHPGDAILLQTIASKRAEDPLIGARVAGDAIFRFLLKALKNEQGVHIETLLTVLGALAGYACQMGIRKIYESRPTEPLPFVVATTTSGQTLYFGDVLNRPLVETDYSVWGLCFGQAMQLGAQLPDMQEMFSHVSATAGSSEFGVPRYPGEGAAADLPVNYLRVFWPHILPVLERWCFEPTEWHVAISIAAQNAIVAAKDAIDPGFAATIVMECAIPMSKMDAADIFKSVE